ncbi:MAG: metallophosphoesterase family protein [Eubacterium sp.]|nr:metallophosphoesterase family protein [Eubacterium sp.]
MRYYIADLHFFHSKLNDSMDCRGFSSGEEMNEYMIRRWNERVTKKDEVVILGDLSVGSAKETTDILMRLNGKLYMIRGNHDHFLESRDFDENRFVWVRDYAHMHDEGRLVVLSHYPMPAYSCQYRRNKKDEPITYMLYGHVHDTVEQHLLDEFILKMRSTLKKNYPDGEEKPIPCQMINCFCKYADYTPLTLDEWIALTEKRLHDQ